MRIRFSLAAGTLLMTLLSAPSVSAVEPMGAPQKASTNASKPHRDDFTRRVGDVDAMKTELTRVEVGHPLCARGGQGVAFFRDEHVRLVEFACATSMQDRVVRVYFGATGDVFHVRARGENYDQPMPGHALAQRLVGKITIDDQVNLRDGVPVFRSLMSTPSGGSRLFRRKHVDPETHFDQMLQTAHHIVKLANEKRAASSSTKPPVE